MRLIVISYPENIQRETEMLIKLFEEGLEYYHLRKPGFSVRQVSAYLDDIPANFHNRIVLHDHYELANDYGLRGIHFTNRSKHLVGRYEGIPCKKSISCHGIEEIKNLEGQYSYVFLSPVFDSISKPGYKSNFSLEEIGSFLPYHPDVEVIALGGIEENNIEMCSRIGFSGVAVLGYLWETLYRGADEMEALLKFNHLKEKCKELARM